MNVGYYGTMVALWAITFCFFLTHGGLLAAVVLTLFLFLPLTLFFIPLALVGGSIGGIMTWLFGKCRKY